jgi:uncharacterized protein YjiS (DUF1127 family)
MSVQTANSGFRFELPSLSYIDAKWEEPSLRAPAENAYPVRKESGLSGWFARRIAQFRSWRATQQAIAELGLMTEHDLRDIGMSRSDLSRAFDPAFNEDLRRRGEAA